MILDLGSEVKPQTETPKESTTNAKPNSSNTNKTTTAKNNDTGAASNNTLFGFQQREFVIGMVMAAFVLILIFK